MQAGNFLSFPHLNGLVSVDIKLEQHGLVKTKEVLSHLDSLTEEFIHYFPDVTMDIVQNPYNTDVELLLGSLLE